MAPEEAQALLERVVDAMLERALPFDLVVAWEETGADAWASSNDSESMVRLLAGSDQIRGVRAAVMLSRAVLHRASHKYRSLAEAAIVAAEAWANKPNEQNRLAALEAGRSAFADYSDDWMLVEGTTAQQASLHATNAAASAAILASVDDVDDADINAVAVEHEAARAADTDTKDEARAAHAALLRQHFTCPTTDELILAAARDT